MKTKEKAPARVKRTPGPQTGASDLEVFGWLRSGHVRKAVWTSTQNQPPPALRRRRDPECFSLSASAMKISLPKAAWSSVAAATALLPGHVAHMPCEAIAEGGSCCYRTPKALRSGGNHEIGSSGARPSARAIYRAGALGRASRDAVA